MPKVSVLIPSYNLAYCIERTIGSVLAQTFTDFELLIEDDASTDGSPALLGAITDPRVTVFLKTKNEGQNRTTNNLVARARGEYVCCLAADDTWEPEKLARQVALLDAQPEVAAVFSWPEFIDDEDRPIEPEDDVHRQVRTVVNLKKEMWARRFMLGNCLFISTSMHRRALHEEIGAFDESLPLLADLDFYMRIVARHEIHVLPERLARIRMRAGGANLSFPDSPTWERHVEELARVREKNHPRKIKKNKFFIATPFYELKGYSPYIESLLNSLTGLARYAKETGIEFEFHHVSGDSYVWRARNTLADRFLKSDCSHLIFIDSDESWEPEGLYRLMKADALVVGAAYPVKNNWQHFGVAIETEGPEHLPRVNAAGLIHAEKVPTGFMKIAREVFERLRFAEPENWYWEPDEYGVSEKRYNFFGHLLENHTVYGEDISFCRRWQRAGGELYVEPRVTIEHYGTQGWKGNYDQFLRQQPGGDLYEEAKAA